MTTDRSAVLYEVHVTSAVRHVKPALFAEAFKKKYGQPLRKVAFFAAREGLRATVRKYRSKALERSVEVGVLLTLARIDDADHSLVLLTRDLGTPLRVDSALIFLAPVGYDLADVLLDGRSTELFESYLPVPECPVADRLAALVMAANPVLTVAAQADLERAEQAGALRRPASLAGTAPTLTRAVNSNSGLQPMGTGAFFVGFGGYVREYVLPHFRGDAIAACDYRAELVGRQYKPATPLFPSIEPLLDVIAQYEQPLVIIASYHSAHAPHAGLVLEANPNARVFIEKPLGVTMDDIRAVLDLREQGRWVDVGYNRRYAPLVAMTKQLIHEEPGPLSMVASVKELPIAASHWYHWPNQGTRVTGNVVHWLDLAVFLAGCDPIRVAAVGTPDRASIAIAFENGANASLMASEDGDGLRGVQEYIEVRTRTKTIRIHDFTATEVVAGGASRVRHYWHRSKGHAEMYRSLRRRWIHGDPPEYPTEDMVRLQRLVDDCLGQLRE